MLDNTDCNDGDSAVNPGAAEVKCDGTDNDCSGGDDEGTDADSDGYKIDGGLCGLVDCDDNDPAQYPGAIESCDNGEDDDCDGDVDGDDSDCGGLDPTLVAYYKFEDNADDETGNYDGTNYGVSFTGGQVGQAASFNGSSYVQIGGDDSFKPLTQGTLAGWINTDLEKTDFLFGVGPKGVSSQGLLFWIFVKKDGGLEIRQRNAANTNNNILASLPASTIDANNWYHLAWAVNSSGNSFYINGVKQTLAYSGGSANSNFFVDDIATTQNYWIGGAKYSSTSVNRFGYGLIDEFKIWNRALSNAEVEAEYS